MAEVKTIDIDGVQWEMKDQTARNKITDIEKNISTEDLPDVQVTLESGYTCRSITMQNHYKAGKIHFVEIVINDISGDNVGTLTTIKIAKSNLIAKKTTSCILRDYIAAITIRGSIDQNGYIYLEETNGINQGNNAIRGEIIFAEP